MINCCKYPFERMQIEFGGDVFFCCPAYSNYCIGNIFKNSFDEIWYGEKATEFRKSIIDGSYKFCNLDICGEYNEKYAINKNNDFLPYPKVVNLSYNPSCNVRCRTCRDKLEVETKEDTEYFNNINDKIVKLCKNAEIVYLNGGGEIFTSLHFKELVHRLITLYPNLKFYIHTNGLLCDETHIKEWGLEGRIEHLYISVHAATKKTYEFIVRGGNWKRLMDNLKYLSLNYNLDLFFVLHSLNYKEMPAFVKIANKLGTKAVFWRFRNWDSSQMCREIDMYSCWEPWHPDYKNFLKVLNKLKRMNGYILHEKFLRELQVKTKDSWYVKLKNLFKMD